MRCTWERGDVLSIDGVAVADLSRSWFRERATATVDGVTWHLGAEGSDRVARRAQGADPEVRARRTSLFGRTWEVGTASASYTVRSAGLFSRRMSVDKDGRQIGELVPRAFSDRPALTTSVDLPHVDAVFLLWLGFVLARRASSSSAGGAAAAASS